MSKKIKVFLLACVLMLMCCMGMTVMASEETTAEVMGHSLTITDTGISVNFYVDIKGLTQNNVEVTLNNKKVNIPTATKQIIDAKAYNLYVFSQPVVAKEMDDKVSLTITSGDKELVKDSYCVNDYVAEVQKGGYSLNFENLANAMTYYGEFAEVYFGYNGATNVTDEATSSISNVTLDSFDGYVASVNKENMPEGLKYYGTQLNLNSKITLRILFEIEDGYTASSYGNFAADGTDLGQLKKVGDYYCVDITGIGAAELGRGYTITCNGEEIITNCSVLTYARAVVRAYSDKENATDKQKSLLNVSKALYLYNQKAVAYVSKPATVFDIFYNGNGFYAEPSFTNKVYLTADKEVTTVSEGNTAITALSQLNGSRTKSCSVWMQTAYTPSENETLTGPYVIRRYADNISVLNIEGTATIASTVDGRFGKFVAQYPDGSSEVNITQADNGEVYVNGTLKVTGNAKTGVVKTSSADVIINAEGLTADGEVVFPNHKTQKLTGDGEISAIKLVDDGHGHFGAYKTAEDLNLGSVICGCGANISQDPTHSCGWVDTYGLQAAYAIEWTAWTDASTLPSTYGSYYLIQDMKNVAARGQLNATGKVLNLDLAGCTVEGSGATSSGNEGLLLRVQAGILNIADSSKDHKGAITMTGAANANGSICAWGNTNVNTYINIFGGTFSANVGTTVTLRRGHINMYGGTILPGTNDGTNTAANAVQVGTNNDEMLDLNVYGGTIKGEVLISKSTATVDITGVAKVGIEAGKDESGNVIPYGIGTTEAVTSQQTINCTNVVSAKESIVLKNLEDVTISGTGIASAFKFLEDGAGHFGVYETTVATEESLPTLNVGSIICGCGANISQDPTHDCPWTDAHTDEETAGLQAAYAINWTAWTKDDSIPTGVNSYYLTQDLKNINNEWQVKAQGEVANLDLAGYTIESAEDYTKFLFRVQTGTLNIADSSEKQSGAIKHTGVTNKYGALSAWGSENALTYLNIFGGTISAEAGTTVSVRQGHISVYGGTIIGASEDGQTDWSFVPANAMQVGAGNYIADLTVSGGTIKGEVLMGPNKSTEKNITISGDSKVGIEVGNDESGNVIPYGIGITGTSAQTIQCNDVTSAKESIVLKNLEDVTISGTGVASAFKFLEDGAGHFGVYETTVATEESLPALSVGSIICGCGANISQDPTHDCPWTDAHTDEETDGLQEAHNLEWMPWTDASTLPSTFGSYYLVQDMKNVAQRGQLNSTGNVLNLDLAGCTVEGSGVTTSGNEGLLLRVQAGILNIADSSKDHKGAITMTGAANANGSICAWGNTNVNTYINIFGGTFSANVGTTVTLRRGHLNMYGGTILPGTNGGTNTTANAVQIGTNNNEMLDLNVYGGTIKGEVLISKAATFTITGDAKVGIEAGKDESGNEKPYGIGTTIAQTVTFDNAKGQIVLKTLNDKGLLEVSGTGEGSAFTVIDSRNKVADDSDEGIGNLVYEAYMCVCGKMDGKYDHTDSCKQPDYAWQPWTSTTGLPTENGSYYLTQNLTGLTTRSQIADGKDINLDLAGYTVEGTGNGGVLYRIQRGSLNLADSSVAQTGAIKATGESTGVGRALYVWGNEGSEWNANIFGGTLTAETGTPVAISRGNINMYGGNIKAGTSVELKLSDAVKFATANSVQVGLYTGQTANLNVKGGNITGEVLIANETSSTVAVSNNVKVGIADEDDAAKAYGIGTVSTVTSAQTIACNDVATDASVVIKNLDKVGVSGTGEESAFTVLEASRNTITDDNPDGIGNLVYEAYMCVCGEMDGNYDHTDDCKKPLSAWKALNSWNISTTTNGSYYLVSDLTANSTVQFDYYQINLDLAGHTIDGEGSVTSLFAPRKTSVLNITDSVGGGVIKNAYNGESTAFGTVIFMPNGDVNKSACTNLYAGTLTAEGGTLGTNSSLATVYIGVGTFNMYGGYVEDNLGDEDNFKAFNKHTYNYTSGTVLEDGIYIKGGEENTFRAGFGKTDISPENGVSLASYGNEETRLSTGVLSPLEAVATVVTDEEDNTLILVVTDLSWGKIASANQIRELVYKAYGIPYENVLIGGTHNHSAPNPEYTDNELNVAYMEYWKTQVMSAIRMAMRDRKAATMEIGTAETENMVYSRRYLCQDGKYVGGGPESYNESEIPWWSTEKYWIQAHESEADEEIQMVRFVRDGENVKDILITQWQSHACNITSDRSEGSDHYKASGEWPQIIRSEVEKNLDVHCMYMQGAAGNLASMSRISGENLYNEKSDSNTIGYNDYVKIGEKVASYVIDTCKASDSFQAVESGLIQTNQYKMPAMLRSTGNPAAGNNRAELNTVAIGDVSLVTLPSELFDTSGKEIKEAGKDFFKMTLIMGYTCGKNLYEAPAWAVEHGCYEVEHGRYQLGTAEIMVNHYIDTLEELYNIKNNIQEPTVEESPEEAKVLKVLTLGHSLGLDSGHLLNLICDAQGIGDYEEVVIGTLYHSGCTMSEHTSYMLHKSKEYDLYLSSSKTPNEPPAIESKVNLEYALSKDYWDIVVMQDGVFDIANSSNYTNGNSHIIQRYINKNKLNTRIRFAWHMTWVAPTDNTLRDKYPYEPNTYYTNYEKFNHERTAVYNAVVKNVTDYVVTDKSFDFIIPSATAFENALSSYLEETDLHRDYVHATDLGRVIASYTWYCKLMGIDQLEEIKLSAIPVNFFKSTTGTEDLVLTDKEKAVILESVNNALANPLQMTQSQYTQ